MDFTHLFLTKIETHAQINYGIITKRIVINGKWTLSRNTGRKVAHVMFRTDSVERFIIALYRQLLDLKKGAAKD